MARIEVAIQGAHSEISASSFVFVVEKSLGILRSLDQAKSHQRGGTLNWVISRLREGSAILELESHVQSGEEDFGAEVRKLFTEGLNLATREGVTPPYYSSDDMAAVLKIIRKLATTVSLGFGCPPMFRISLPNCLATRSKT